MIAMTTCPFCSKNVLAGRSFGGHKTNCRLNPKNVETRRKNADAQRCKNLLYRFCVKCGKMYSTQASARDIELDRITRHCSRSCANTRIHSQITKAKIALAMSRNVDNNDHKLIICTECQISMMLPRTSKALLCSTCRSAVVKRKLSAKLKGRTGGYRVRSGTSKFHGSWYRGYWMDSSWERAMAERLDALNISWDRGERFLLYLDLKGRERKYYPDFFLIDQDFFLEVKGYWTPDVRHKMDDVQRRHPGVKIVVLESREQVDSFSI